MRWRLGLAAVVATVLLLTGCTTEEIIHVWFDRYGASMSDKEDAIDVARCESSLNPEARNGDYYGLFQISRTYHEARARSLGYTWGEMLQAGPNAHVAASLWSEQGWQPWACKP